MLNNGKNSSCWNINKNILSDEDAHVKNMPRISKCYVHMMHLIVVMALHIALPHSVALHRDLKSGKFAPEKKKTTISLAPFIRA